MIIPEAVKTKAERTKDVRPAKLREMANTIQMNYHAPNCGAVYLPD